jgi:hypothetical protein
MTEAWTAPQVEHTEPRLIPDERQAIKAWMDSHRNNYCIVRRPDRRPAQGAGGAPVRLSLLRLVRHMTEVERWWSRNHAANFGMPLPHDPDQTGRDPARTPSHRAARTPGMKVV